MLMMVMSIFFSVMSTGMMSYLTMSTQIGPWVAPVFVVVCMVFVIPFIKSKWFYEHAVVAIASGSVGGMIGICLGLSFPSFYVLHKNLFESWVADPVKLCFLIFGFVVCAGLYALFLSYFLRHYFLHKSDLTYPMSQLVYDVIFIDKHQKSHHRMLAGVGVATVWNLITISARSSLAMYVPQIHMFPLVSTVGFIAGISIVFPIVLGFCIRVFILDMVRIYSGSLVSGNSFLITFCFGMLISLVARMIWHAWKTRNDQQVYKRTLFWHETFLKSKFFLGSYVLILAASFALLHSFGVSAIICLYSFVAIAWLSKYMVEIIGEIGIIDVDNYVWFVLLPLLYAMAPASDVLIAVAVFSMLSLGLIVDFMFSYKLADLAQVSYRKIVRYQLFALFSAAAIAGVFFLWFSQMWKLNNFALVGFKAHELDDVIQFGFYDYRVLLSGIVTGFLVLIMTSELLVTIGAVIMAPFTSITLVVAGICAHLIKKKERWYPLWFGVYAGHMLWLIVQAFLYHK
ncbi:hypothetical protein KAZ82_02750 [Candidatus Babeliales bacterium]|nr:hypothetical protein [Candidatus Babeliales bacterium]